MMTSDKRKELLFARANAFVEIKDALAGLQTSLLAEYKESYTVNSSDYTELRDAITTTITFLDERKTWAYEELTDIYRNS